MLAEFSGDDYDLGAVVLAAQTVSMFGDRVVVARNLARYGTAAKKGAAAADQGDDGSADDDSGDGDSGGPARMRDRWPDPRRTCSCCSTTWPTRLPTPAWCWSGAPP